LEVSPLTTQYRHIPKTSAPPPPPGPQPFKPGRVQNAPAGTFSQSADGTSFTTEEPFTVDDYAIWAHCSTTDAQAALTAAVTSGDVGVV
jgi:hypothetical protein